MEAKMDHKNRQAEETKLLKAIAQELPCLESLMETVAGENGYEDPIYRFYHQSFKVFRLQGQIQRIVEVLQSLAPELPLNPWFTEIVAQGTGKEFQVEINQYWAEATRPILEAFFHARYFLEMVAKYGRELTEPPQPMPSGWAAVMELYGLR
jgi:hypothetical protein